MGNAQAGGMGGAPQGAGASGAGGVDTAHSYRDPDPSTFLPNGKPVYVNVYHLMPGGPMNNLNGAIAGLGAFLVAAAKGRCAAFSDRKAQVVPAGMRPAGGHAKAARRRLSFR